MSDGHISIQIDDNADKVAKNLKGLERDIQDMGGLEVEIRVREEDIKKAGDRLDRFKKSLEEKAELKFSLDSFLSDIGTGKITIQQLQDTLNSFSVKDYSEMGRPLAESLKKAREDMVRMETSARETGLSLSKYLGDGAIGQTSLQNIVNQLKGLDTSHLSEGLERANNSAQKMESTLKRAVISKEKLVRRSEELNRKIRESQTSMSKLNESIGLGSSVLGRSIKDLGRYVLALIGIRSIYLGLQRVTTSWLNSGQEGAEQLQADMEAMRIALGSALAPVIRWIVDHLALALGYVNELLKIFFGISLNARNVTKEQRKQIGGAKALNKELQKQLASFDEINKLQDNSSTGGGGGGGISAGDIKPFEIPAPDVTKFAEAIKKAIEILKKLFPLIATIGTLLLAWKLYTVAKSVSDFYKAISRGLGGFGKFAIGLGLVVAGVTGLMVGLSKLIFHWNELDKKQKIIYGVVTALGVAFTALGLMMMGVPPHIAIIGTVVVTAVTAVGMLVKSLLDEKEAIMDTKTAHEALKKAQEDVTKAHDEYVSAVDKAEESQKKLVEAEQKAQQSGKELFDKVQNGTVDYINLTDAQRSLYKAYIENEARQRELKASTDKLLEAKNKEKIASWENQLALDAEGGKYDEFKNKVVEAYTKGELKAEEARDLIGKAMSGMSKSAQQTFARDIPNEILNGLDPAKYQTRMQRFASWLIEWWGYIKEAFRIVLNGIIDRINRAIAGINRIRIPDYVPYFGGKGANIQPLPRLATGGIAVRPTQAIIGEAGREAVLPLDRNTEWLDLLVDKMGGREINITLTNVMDGDEISRKTYRHMKMKDLSSLGTLY